MKSFKKFVLPANLAVALLFILILPVTALVKDYDESRVSTNREVAVEGVETAQIVDGVEVELRFSNTGASPVIDVSSDGTFVAVAYFKNDNDGGVHLKSATLAQGWLTTEYLGNGQTPALAFSRASNNRVFVVWQSDQNQSIDFASCTLSATSSPSCDVNKSITIESGTFQTPAIAVDNSNRIHVAWVQDTLIRTALSDDGGQTWDIFPSVANLPGGSVSFETPQLAVADTALHLTFRRKVEGGAVEDDLGKEIRYYRSTNFTNHTWADVQVFNIGTADEVDDQYDDLANPTIAATGDTVHLAWDAYSESFADDNAFGLIRVESTDNGQSWSTPRHITTETTANNGVDDDPKISRKFSDALVPVQEAALRPSLAISGTSFAIVWQEREIDVNGCSEDKNASSEIQFAYLDGGWSEEVVTVNMDFEYSIDPDIAVDTLNSREHIIYMKDEAPITSCTGGDKAAYKIFYHGPFEETSLDTGEDADDPGSSRPTIYLPIVLTS